VDGGFILQSTSIDKRDQRDPEKLYQRIKQVQENNKDMTFLQACDAVQEMYNAHTKGNGHATH